MKITVKRSGCLTWPRAVAWLALGFGVVASGCSGITGLRSVGTGRSSWLGLWDRSGPGSPTPENDSYAQHMHASDPQRTPLAQKNRQRRQGTEEASDDFVAERMADASAEPAVHDGAGDSREHGQDSLRVTLGRPEPLPGMMLAQNTTTSGPSDGTSPGWKAGGADANGDKGQQPARAPDPELAQGEAAPAEADAPTGLADNSKAAGAVDPKVILTKAEDRLASLGTYQVKFTRAERVNGQLQPEEDIILSVQRQPKAVRLEWVSGPSKGREVIYASNIDPRMIFVHLSSSAIPLPAMKIPVDSPLVMRNSRHAITEAGFDTIIASLRKAEGGNDRNQSEGGKVEYKGIEQARGMEASCHHFVRRTRNGETWNVFLDAESLMPTLVDAEDSKGNMIEHYVYRAVRENPTELAAAAAFQPDKRWGDAPSLLSRFARAAGVGNSPGTGQSTTR